MSEIKKIVESISPASSTILVINELGPIGSHLVDVLLGLGCQVYYLGSIKEDYLDHLLGRNNFEFLRQFNKIQELPDLNYIFYLADKSGKLLPPIAKICQGKKIKFLFGFRGNSQLAERILRELTATGVDGRICLFKEIYGPRIRKGIASSIIESAYLGKKIKIPAGDNLVTQLIFYSDFIKGATRAMLAPDTAGKIINIGGESVSFLALINELEKRIHRSLETEFLKEKTVTEPIETTRGKNPDFDWQSLVSLPEGVEETISWLEREKEKPSGSSKKIKLIRLPSFFHSAKKRKIIFGLTIFLFLVFVFFLVPILVFMGSMSSAKKSFELAERSWEEGEFVKVKIEVKKASQKVDFSRKIFDLSSPFYETFGLGSGIKQIENLLTIETKTLESLESTFQICDIILPSFSSLLRGERINLKPKIGEINSLLDKIYANTSYLLVALEDNQLEKSISKTFRLEKYLAVEKVLLPDVRKKIWQARTVLSFIPAILGDPDKKVYLILFQNNLELRPTGGLISSLGVLSFEKEKLVDFEIKDTDSLEDRVDGQIDPPPKIKEYLGESRWLMKDGNWDPDFVTTARQIEWFFEKQTGREVDGVIGINLSSFQKILESTGGLSLPEWTEKVTASNLLEKVEYSPRTESGFLNPESDLFGKLANLFFEKLKSEGEKQLISFFRAVYESLDEKEILIYLHEAQVAEYLRFFNWDGSVQPNLACQKITNNCLADYLFINEANLGGNRANFFIKRILNHNVLLSNDGKVWENLKIFYQNTSSGEVWPAGRYRNYLRLYLPLGSQFESLMVNDPSEPGLWVQMPLDRIDFTSESGKMVVGFFLEVPIKSVRVVEIKYSPPFNVDFSKPFFYTLLTQKQSGAGETVYKFLLNFPTQVRSLRILPKGELTNGKILIDDQLDADKIFRVDFGR